MCVSLQLLCCFGFYSVLTFPVPTLPKVHLKTASRSYTSPRENLTVTPDLILFYFFQLIFLGNFDHPPEVEHPFCQPLPRFKAISSYSRSAVAAAAMVQKK